MNAHDIELALRARAAFNDSVERIDTDTRSRLRNLRLRAQKGETDRARARWIWPAGAALTAALALAVFLPRLPHAETPSVQPVAAIATAALPSSGGSIAQTGIPARVGATAAPDPLETTDPELLRNLDFYGWLAKQPGQNTAGG